MAIIHLIFSWLVYILQASEIYQCISDLEIFTFKNMDNSIRI